jgi:hypothetical protein
MHASIWTFTGDPDDLVVRIENLVAEAAANVRLMVVVRRPDGVTLVDTCPSRDAYERFRASGWLETALHAAGLPMPEIADHPVQLVVVDGSVISGRDVGVAAPA